jgi:hypothetical protein
MPAEIGRPKLSAATIDAKLASFFAPLWCLIHVRQHCTHNELKTKNNMETSSIKPPQLSQKKSGLPIPGAVLMLIIGALIMLFWLMVYLWAQGHSPHMGFMEMASIAAQDPNRFIFNPTAYSVLMLVIAGGELLGVVVLIVGLITLAKKKV